MTSYLLGTHTETATAIHDTFPPRRESTGADASPAVTHTNASAATKRPAGRGRSNSTSLIRSIGHGLVDKGVIPFSPSLLPGLPRLVRSERGRRAFSPIQTLPGAKSEFSKPFAVFPPKSAGEPFDYVALSRSTTPAAFSSLSTAIPSNKLSRGFSVASQLDLLADQDEEDVQPVGQCSAPVGDDSSNTQESLIRHQSLSLELRFVPLPDPPPSPARPKRSQRELKSKARPANGPLASPAGPDVGAMNLSSPIRPSTSHPAPAKNVMKTPRLSRSPSIPSPSYPSSLNLFTTPPPASGSLQTARIQRRAWRPRSPDTSKPLQLLGDHMSITECLQAGTTFTPVSEPLVPNPPRAEDIAPLSPTRLRSKNASPLGSIAGSRPPTAPSSPSICSASSHHTASSSVSVRAVATLDFTRPKGQRISSRLGYRSASDGPGSVGSSVSASRPPSRASQARSSSLSRTSSSSSGLGLSPWSTPFSEIGENVTTAGNEKCMEGGRCQGYFPRVPGMALEPSPEICERRSAYQDSRAVEDVAARMEVLTVKETAGTVGLGERCR